MFHFCNTLVNSSAGEIYYLTKSKSVCRKARSFGTFKAYHGLATFGSFVQRLFYCFRLEWVQAVYVTNVTSPGILHANALSQVDVTVVGVSIEIEKSATNATRLVIMPGTARKIQHVVTVVMEKVTLLKTAFRALICRPVTIAENRAILLAAVQNREESLMRFVTIARGQDIFQGIVLKILKFATYATNQAILRGTVKKMITESSSVYTVLFVVFYIYTLWNYLFCWILLLNQCFLFIFGTISWLIFL